ncbi:hypothetical protein SteCoe_16554 [Stentor coeruleus]|uniref:IBB domain-containing protein n=1 Tax=Stentor coeruleus TaxID=5963 RepID=A0A1R2C0Y1_9CILI|nr:hypothetical protein SteCoe_16554 [Stentor coeruleus]
MSTGDRDFKHQDRLNFYQKSKEQGKFIDSAVKLRKKLRLVQLNKNRQKKIPCELKNLNPESMRTETLQEIFSRIKKNLDSRREMKIQITELEQVICCENFRLSCLDSSEVLTSMLSLIKFANDPEILDSCYRCLSNFTCCSENNSKYALSLGALETVLSQLSSSISPLQCYSMLILLSNLIITSEAFRVFQRLYGFKKLQLLQASYIQYKNIPEAFSTVYNQLIDFVEEFSISDLQTFLYIIETIPWVSTNIMFSDLLYILDKMSFDGNIVHNTFPTNLIMSLIASMNSQNLENSTIICQIFGNSLCRGFLTINETQTCTFIENLLQNFCEYSNVWQRQDSANNAYKYSLIWLSRCLLAYSPCANIILNTQLYSQIGNFLLDSKAKVRNQSVKFFIELFSHDSYQKNNIMLPINLLDCIGECLRLDWEDKMKIRILEIVKLMVKGGDMSEHVKVSLETSSLVEKIEELVFCKNRNVMIEAIVVLEMIEFVDGECEELRMPTKNFELC